MEDRAVERYKVANGIADKSGVTLTKLRKLGHSWQASYNPQTRLSESLDRFCDIVERVIGGPA